MKGIRCATAFFITRADLITCTGREGGIKEIKDHVHVVEVYLREEHLAGPEEVADDRHAGHERPLDDIEGPGVEAGVLPGLLRVLHHPLVDPLHQGVL